MDRIRVDTNPFGGEAIQGTRRAFVVLPWIADGVSKDFVGVSSMYPKKPKPKQSKVFASFF